MKILLGSNNPKKLKELKKILSGLGVEALPAREAGVHCEVIEDGKSFSENAAKKAIAYAQASGLPAVADDSGLEVDSLGGEPGIYSARYASGHCDYENNNAKLLERMKSVPDGKRQARFRCAIALAHPEKGVLFTVAGNVEGIIIRTPRGSGGFGYDPLFFYPPADKTFAEMLPDEKNKVSHRSKALVKFKEKLEEIF